MVLVELALPKAEDAIEGPSSTWRYQNDYYNAADNIVCSTGSGSEGEPDPLDPPEDPNEEDWVAWYTEHVRRRAKGGWSHQNDSQAKSAKNLFKRLLFTSKVTVQVCSSFPR